MKKVNLELKINKDEFKKKLDIKDGDDGSSDTGEDIVRKINELSIHPSLQIDSSHIKNLATILGGRGGGGDITGAVTGSGVSGQVAFWNGAGSLTGDPDLTFDGVSLHLGTPTTAVTNTDLVIGVSSNTRTGLIIQTKAGTTLPAFAIQDSTGTVKASFNTTGNGAMRINYSGTMATAGYAGFVLSIQNMNDAGEGSWLEILNGQAGRGAFFGMIGNQFQLFNWQAGDIEFWTGLGGASPGANYVRSTITSAGNFGFSAFAEYGWSAGWGGGVGVLGIRNATTAPTTSLSTTALALYSVSQELWYMSASNQARKLTASTAALTSGRIPIVTTGGLLTDDADLTFATDTLSATKVAMSSLTSGRIPIVSTAGLLIDDADLTFATDTLTATKVVGTTSVKVGTAAGYISSDGSPGATGEFTSADGYTIYVKDGIITEIRA